MKMSIKEQNRIRESVYSQLAEVFTDALRISEGLVIEVPSNESEEQKVVIRVIVKDMEKFDLDDALTEYEDKIAKAKKKEEEKAKKEAERKAKAEAKKAEAEAKKANK